MSLVKPEPPAIRCIGRVVLPRTSTACGCVSMIVSLEPAGTADGPAALRSGSPWRRSSPDRGYASRSARRRSREVEGEPLLAESGRRLLQSGSPAGRRARLTDISSMASRIAASLGRRSQPSSPQASRSSHQPRAWSRGGFSQADVVAGLVGSGTARSRLEAQARIADFASATAPPRWSGGRAWEAECLRGDRLQGC